MRQVAMPPTTPPDITVLFRQRTGAADGSRTKGSDQHREGSDDYKMCRLCVRWPAVAVLAFSGAPSLLEPQDRKRGKQDKKELSSLSKSLPSGMS